jgi:GMP synthase (glutamine-hydrolysing)
MDLRFLLLQARRSDDTAREEEHVSFSQKLGIPLSSITCHNLLSGPPNLQRVREFDALLIGGSGDFYVSKRNLPSFGKLIELLREVAEIGHPTFASCFGFQCLVEALGGEIIHDPENTEVGTYQIELAAEGINDPLLGSLPESFLAQLGRKDRAAKLPPSVPNLAFSSKCPYQAFRIPGQPIWAFQFHPELGRYENRLRFERYIEGYAPFLDSQERERALNGFKESPETESLLSTFVQLVFG